MSNKECYEGEPIERQIAFAIVCALAICHDPHFNIWAHKWLSNEDRTPDLAGEIANDLVYTHNLNITRETYIGSDAADCASYQQHPASNRATIEDAVRMTVDGVDDYLSVHYDPDWEVIFELAMEWLA